MSSSLSHINGKIYLSSNDTDLSFVTNISTNFTDQEGYIHNLIIPSAKFVSQSPTQIIFNIPDSCYFAISALSIQIKAGTGPFPPIPPPYPPVPISPTVFSGSILLNPNLPIIANASGIYRLIIGKTNDTLYIDSAVSDATIDIKIPDPNAKTGFIGG